MHAHNHHELKIYVRHIRIDPPRQSVDCEHGEGVCPKKESTKHCASYDQELHVVRPWMQTRPRVVVKTRHLRHVLINVEGQHPREGRPTATDSSNVDDLIASDGYDHNGCFSNSSDGFEWGAAGCGDRLSCAITEFSGLLNDSDTSVRACS